MLKLNHRLQAIGKDAQPPSGGCVLKRFLGYLLRNSERQPPSGGCVLKLVGLGKARQHKHPAAFGRLCVETAASLNCCGDGLQPPSGGCVLKPHGFFVHAGTHEQPPSGGCVLKLLLVLLLRFLCCSRLRAAVC